MEHHDEAAAQLLRDTAEAAGSGKKTRTVAFRVEITVPEADWQTHVAELIRKAPRDGGPEFNLTLDRVIDEMIATGLTTATLEFLMDALPIAVAGYQSNTLNPIGSTKLKMMVPGEGRVVRFQFEPSSD